MTFRKISIFTKQCKLVVDCIVKCQYSSGNLSVQGKPNFETEIVTYLEILNTVNFVETVFITYIPLIQQKNKKGSHGFYYSAMDVENIERLALMFFSE